MWIQPGGGRTCGQLIDESFLEVFRKGRVVRVVHPDVLIQVDEVNDRPIDALATDQRLKHLCWEARQRQRQPRGAAPGVWRG